MELIYRTGPLPKQHGGKMVNIGIDLHKTQFTVGVRGCGADRFEKYPTTEERVQGVSGACRNMAGGWRGSAGRPVLLLDSMSVPVHPDACGT